MNILKEKLQSIRYTIDHRRAFRLVERSLLGHNTVRGLFHDLDKIFLKLFLNPETVSRLHRGHSRHHSKARSHADYIQMVIDWECARFTKPDKPLNAVQTLYRFYPEREPEVLPVLKELGLCK